MKYKEAQKINNKNRNKYVDSVLVTEGPGLELIKVLFGGGL